MYQVVILEIVVLLMSEDSFNYLKDRLSEEVEQNTLSLNNSYGDNDSITFSIKELNYGLEYYVKDTELGESQYVKLQWDGNGMLKRWERTTIKDGEISGMLIKRSLLTIPSFPMEVFLVFIVISIVGIITSCKKHKYNF